MEPSNTLYSSILLLGAAHGLFLALALINVKGGYSIAHRLLAILTLTFAADLGVDFLYESRYLMLFPKLTYIEQVVSFLYGPLTFLYVRALTDKQGFQFSLKTWLHFLPFVVSVGLLVPFYLLSDTEIIELVYNDADVDSVGFWVIGAILVLVLPIPQIGVYLALAVRRLIRHGNAVRDQFSSIERISLNWLRNLLIALGTLFLIYASALFFSAALGASAAAERLLNLLIVIVIYSMGYMGIRQPAIFTQRRSKPESKVPFSEAFITTPVGSTRKKYQKSALDSEMSSALLSDLQRHMASEKPYLDSTLTLTQLAAQLGISQNYLSQTINEHTGSNFFDFINRHRVTVAKQLLEDSKRTNILSIAMEAGFNSKSAFYTAFKQHTHMTPSEFRKSAVSA